MLKFQFRSAHRSFWRSHWNDQTSFISRTGKENWSEWCASHLNTVIFHFLSKLIRAKRVKGKLKKKLNVHMCFWILYLKNSFLLYMDWLCELIRDNIGPEIWVLLLDGVTHFGPDFNVESLPDAWFLIVCLKFWVTDAFYLNSPEWRHENFNRSAESSLLEREKQMLADLR